MKHFTTKIRLRRHKRGTYPREYEDVSCQVDLEIDEDALARKLGQKAIENKSARSSLVNGMIKCNAYPLPDGRGQKPPETVVEMETQVPRVGTARQSTLATTGSWNASYNLDVVEWLMANGLEENPENVRKAMAALKAKRDAS